MNDYIQIAINLAYIALLLIFYISTNPAKFLKLSDKLGKLVILTNVFSFGWSFAIYKASSKLYLSENGVVDQSIVEVVQQALKPLTVHFTLPLLGIAAFSIVRGRLNSRNRTIEEMKE